MPGVGIFRSDLREAAVAVLLAAGTNAGSRVFSPRTWPQSPAELPALIVTTPAERKQSLGRSAPRFDSTISLAVLVRVRGQGANAPAMSADAEDQLDQLCAQVETALLCAQQLVSIVQEFSDVETQMIVSAESEAIIGEASITFACEVCQDFEPDGIPLTDMVMTVPVGDDVPPITLDLPIPQ